MGKLLLKSNLTEEIIESGLKKENTSTKSNNTYRNKNKSLNTTNLVSAILFYHRKNYLLHFSVASENLLKARAFLNNAIPLGIHLLEKIISHIR